VFACVHHLHAQAHSTDLSRFLRDANSFVVSSRAAIERSAPHIYISALPFAAKGSVLYQTFSPLCTGLISVETCGIDHHAGRLVMSINDPDGAAIKSVAYSPDGLFLRSGAADGSVRTWDPRTGDEAMSPLCCSTQLGEVFSISLSPDGHSIAAGTSRDVFIWSLARGLATPRKLSIQREGEGDERETPDIITSVFPPVFENGVKVIQFSPDGRFLASISADGTLSLWNIEKEQPVVMWSANNRADLFVYAAAAAFSPDSQVVATSFGDAVIHLHDVTTGNPRGEPFLGHENLIISLSFSPDGFILASGDMNGQIRLWNPQSGIHIATLGGHTGHVTCTVFAPDRRFLVSASNDNSVRIWPLPYDAIGSSSIIVGHHDGYMCSVTLSPDGLYIASVSLDGNIRIWDADSIQSTNRPLTSHDRPDILVVPASNGSAIVSALRDNSVLVCNVRTGEPSFPPLLGHTNKVHSVAISADGLMIASSSKDRTILLWDGKTGENIGQLLQPGEEPAYNVMFSPDARLLVSISWRDNTVHIWDVATRQAISFSPLRIGESVTALTFSSNNLLIAAGDDKGQVYFWHLGDGRSHCEPLQVCDFFIRHISLAPDGTRLACTASGNYDPKTYVWDVSGRQEILVLDGHNPEYFPDGRIIASISFEGTINLWDAFTGILIARLSGHQDVILSLSCTPDSRSIISSSWDRTIRTWDIEAAMSVSSDPLMSPVHLLASVTLEDGWLKGPSGELLLWVPPDYGAYICAPPYTRVMGRQRVEISGEAEDLHAGERWSSCWRGAAAEMASM